MVTYLTSSARIGRKIIIVAVLLANSVNKAITIVISTTATAGGTLSRGCRWPPIQTDKPDSCSRRENAAGFIFEFLHFHARLRSFHRIANYI